MWLNSIVSFHIQKVMSAAPKWAELEQERQKDEKKERKNAKHRLHFIGVIQPFMIMHALNVESSRERVRLIECRWLNELIHRT